METKTFEINERQYTFVNETVDTRNGFAHKTTLLRDGYEIGRNRVNYLNRTWECYRYQSAMKGLISNLISEREENLKSEFKAERGIKRMSDKLIHIFEDVCSEDGTLKIYKEIYKKL